MFVRVAASIPSDKTFIYAVPDALSQDVCIGKRALIPMNKRRLTGYIIEVMSSSSVENTKEIIEILDSEPLFDENDLLFFQWVSRYYIYPLGKSLSEILPGGIDLKSNRWIIPAKNQPDNDTTIASTSYGEILAVLAEFPKGLPLSRLKNIMKGKNIYRDLRLLQRMGLIQAEEKMAKPDISLKKEKIAAIDPGIALQTKLTKRQRELIDFLKLHGPVSFTILRASFKNVSGLANTLEKQGIIRVTEKEMCRSPGGFVDIEHCEGAIVPNEDQEMALREIVQGLQCRRFSPYLLHGVTGSGKTEVYLNAVEEALRMEGGIILLVPEISLTPQLLTRIKKRFQNWEIAVLHSGVSKSARYDQWRRIQRGDIRIVVGARSAIFAPVRNLKLIIVDEEHDPSYKQDDRVRYNARDLAIMKAKILSAVVVIGSATPAVQTYFNTMKGKYTYLVLPGRVRERSLPCVEIVDMKGHMEGSSRGSVPILSGVMTRAIQETLDNRKQTLLFLNRRGFHTFIFCPDCGHVFQCLNCAVSMTHHAGEGILKCHHCDFSIRIPPSCPRCRGARITHYGVGTERLADEITRLYPRARVGRMDSDTTVRKGSYEQILRALNRLEMDILVGTQMITKGHDFRDVTLVGIISADTSLNMPDFRAAERTFQLLTQASGRGGRGASPGRVIIQTFNPDHYAIVRAGAHDYPGFYDDELSLRRSLSYPPYSRLVNLHLSSVKQDAGMKGIETLKRLVNELARAGKPESTVDIIGPTEAPIPKIKGRYRWQLLLKGRDAGSLHRLTRTIMSLSHQLGLTIQVDVDPVNFM